MNEMDLMTKIEGLEKAIAEHKDFSNTYQDQLKTVQKQLEDYNKPELTPAMMDEIHDAVEAVLSDFDWTDTDNYQDLEYELDYDGRVSLSNIGFDPYDLQEKLYDRVCNLFKEADCPEDEPTADQINNATYVEKVI